MKAAAAQVETASSQVGVLVGEKQMVDLPLNGRDYNQLIILAPGMQPVTNNLQSSLMGRATTFMVVERVRKGRRSCSTAPMCRATICRAPA